MYKVMIVDDEPLILQGLKNIIEWDKLGFEIVSSCENGEKAYAEYKLNPVDLIITDINMPKLTGLELIKKLRLDGENVKCIILSGYDDFKFAQNAIKLGVEDYILKPIDEEALELILDKVYRYFEDTKKKQHLLIDKNIKLGDLLRGKLSGEELEEIKSVLNIKLRDSAYTVTNIAYNKGNDENFIIGLQEVLDASSNTKYELVKVFDGQIFILNSWQLDIGIFDIKEYFDNILVKINNNLEAEAFISIGTIVKSVDSIVESYDNVNELKKYILIEGNNKCIDDSIVEYRKDVGINILETVDDLHRLILDKNLSSIQKYIDESLSNKELSPSEIYDLAIKMIILIDRISEEFALSKYGQTGLSTAIINICQEKTLEGISEFILNEIKDLIDKMNSYNENYSPVVQQVIQTIHLHCDEELSLKTLALKYNMNSSYLGQIFSKEVGVAFSEYLNKTKNMKAKELILNTNMKINDVAKAVGYLDTSYFYRKFKKYYGVSPSTLRELKNY